MKPCVYLKKQKQNTSLCFNYYKQCYITEWQQHFKSSCLAKTVVITVHRRTVKPL